MLKELSADESLERFRNEYEKLHRALKKSHESEKRLIKKCQELNAEIVANAAKVLSKLMCRQSGILRVQILDHDLCVSLLTRLCMHVCMYVCVHVDVVIHVCMYVCCHCPQSLDSRYRRSSGSSIKLWTISGSPGTHGTAKGWEPPTQLQWPVTPVDGMIADLCLCLYVCM